MNDDGLIHEPRVGGTITVLFVGEATVLLGGLLVLVAKTRGWL